MAACVSCGGVLADWLEIPIDAKTRQPTPYGRARYCARCELGVINPLPDRSEIAGFYELEHYYTHGSSHFAEGETPNVLDRLRVHLAWLLDRGEEIEPASLVRRTGRPPGEVEVLDVGCGDGQLLSRFRSLGARVSGLEPDPSALSALAAAGVAVHRGTAEDPPASLEGKSFDIVTMTHSLEHCRDPLAGVRSAYELVRPGGIFLCETPNCACTHFLRFNIISEMFDAPRHLYFFTPKSLRGLIEKAGFEIQRDYYRGFVRHFSNAWRATENEIRKAVAEYGANDRLPPEHTRGQSLRLLIDTAFAGRARKYDCVGYICRRPD